MLLPLLLALELWLPVASAGRARARDWLALVPHTAVLLILVAVAVATPEPAASLMILPTASWRFMSPALTWRI